MPEEAEVRSSVTVVTSENLAEFQNKIIDEKSPPVEAEPEVKEPEAKEEEKVEVEDKDEQGKPLSEEEKAERRKGKLNKRFSELTEQRDAQTRRAEAAERAAAELKAKYEAPKTEEELGPEPTPAQFQDVNEFTKALKEWTTENTKRELAKETSERVAKEHHERVIKTWQERVAAAQKEMPDYTEKLAGSQVQVSDQVRDAIIESEVGPQILYHFAEHPEEAERIGKLTVGGALRELGKLEARLEKKEPATPVTKSAVLTPVAEVSKAPAPIAPLKGANKPVENRVDSNGQYHGTYAQYKKDRAAGKIK